MSFQKVLREYKGSIRPLVMQNIFLEGFIYSFGTSFSNISPRCLNPKNFLFLQMLVLTIFWTISCQQPPKLLVDRTIIHQFKLAIVFGCTLVDDDFT